MYNKGIRYVKVNTIYLPFKLNGVGLFRFIGILRDVQSIRACRRQGRVGEGRHPTLLVAETSIPSGKYCLSYELLEGNMQQASPCCGFENKTIKSSVNHCFF